MVEGKGMILRTGSGRYNLGGQMRPKARSAAKAGCATRIGAAKKLMDTLDTAATLRGNRPSIPIYSKSEAQSIPSSAVWWPKHPKARRRSRSHIIGNWSGRRLRAAASSLRNSP